MSLIQGQQQRSAANRAAEAARQVGEFNAGMIERDIGLLEKSRSIYNANFLVAQVRSRDAFEREVQGTARNGFGYAGVQAHLLQYYVKTRVSLTMSKKLLNLKTH
jgi:hypothetical protein